MAFLYANDNTKPDRTKKKETPTYPSLTIEMNVPVPDIPRCVKNTATAAKYVKTVKPVSWSNFCTIWPRRYQTCKMQLRGGCRPTVLAIARALRSWQGSSRPRSRHVLASVRLIEGPQGRERLSPPQQPLRHLSVRPVSVQRRSREWRGTPR